MAAPSVFAIGLPATGTGGISVPVPAERQLNDIIFVFVQTANQDIADPAGYTEVVNSPQGTGIAAQLRSTRLLIFWKRSDGTETTVSVADSGDHTYGYALLVRGAILSGNPVDVSAGDVLADPGDTVVTIPGATTTVIDCLILLAVAHGLDVTSSQLSSFSNGSLSSLLEQVDKSTNTNAGGGIAVASGVKSAAGAYSATTATLANPVAQARISLAVKPEPPPVGSTRKVLVSFADLKTLEPE